MMVGKNVSVGVGVGKDRGVSFTSTLPTFKRHQLQSPKQDKANVSFDSKW